MNDLQNTFLVLSEAFPPETTVILFLGNFENRFCFFR